MPGNRPCEDGCLCPVHKGKPYRRKQPSLHPQRPHTSTGETYEKMTVEEVHLRWPVTKDVPTSMPDHVFEEIMYDMQACVHRLHLGNIWILSKREQRQQRMTDKLLGIAMKGARQA